MKINFRIFAALLVAGSFSCKAQLGTLEGFTHLGDRFDKQWSAGTFKIEGRTFAGLMISSLGLLFLRMLKASS
jgi:2-phospho-L-lactate transferase/gluconeogenesis factor (CofD/UPF0052 family)